MNILHRLYNYLFRSLAGWLILCSLLILGLLIPFIVVDKMYFVEKGNQDLFLDQSRFTARLLADIIESQSLDENEADPRRRTAERGAVIGYVSGQPDVHRGEYAGCQDSSKECHPQEWQIFQI